MRSLLAVVFTPDVNKSWRVADPNSLKWLKTEQPVFYMKTTDLIQVEGLRRRFDLSEPWLVRLLARRPKRFLDAVDDVSFSIERGKTYALVGESGSGNQRLR